MSKEKKTTNKILKEKLYDKNNKKQDLKLPLKILACTRCNCIFGFSCMYRSRVSLEFFTLNGRIHRQEWLLHIRATFQTNCTMAPGTQYLRNWKLGSSVVGNTLYIINDDNIKCHSWIYFSRIISVLRWYEIPSDNTVGEST